MSINSSKMRKKNIFLLSGLHYFFRKWLNRVNDVTKGTDIFQLLSTAPFPVRSPLPRPSKHVKVATKHHLAPKTYAKHKHFAGGCKQRAKQVVSSTQHLARFFSDSRLVSSVFYWNLGWKTKIWKRVCNVRGGFLRFLIPFGRDALRQKKQQNFMSDSARHERLCLKGLLWSGESFMFKRRR